jgi:hypothetical protein
MEHHAMEPMSVKMGGSAAMKNPDLDSSEGSMVAGKESIRDSIKSHAMKMEKMEDKTMKTGGGL